MDVVDARTERLRRSLTAKIKEGERSARMERTIPGAKVMRDLTHRFRMKAKVELMPKSYVRKRSQPRGYLFRFKDARGIGVPSRLRL